MWMLTSQYKPKSHNTPTALTLKDQEREKAECIDQFMKGLSEMVAATLIRKADNFDKIVTFP